MDEMQAPNTTPYHLNVTTAVQARIKLLECKIENFCDQGKTWRFSNAWIKQKGLASLYLRSSLRLIYELTNRDLSKESISSKMTPVLDIAAIQVEAVHQRKGIGSHLINYCHLINPQKVTYIECVHNPILAGWLERNGWTSTDEVNKCFYKIK